MVEAAKKIADMWMKMAKLIRSEFGTFRRFKEEIVELTQNINKESQKVIRIATGAAEECSDSRMEMVGPHPTIVL